MPNPRDGPLHRLPEEREMNRDYVADVRKFGSRRPYVDKDGNKYNMPKGAPLPPGSVRTNGHGHITDMPIVRRPCFGRPERFVRGSHEEAIPPFTGRNKTERWRLTRCQRCEVTTECSDVVEERIKSSPQVEAAFVRWDDATAGAGSKEAFEGRSGKQLWGEFLTSIEAHGGWSSINDENIAAADAQKEIQRKADAAADQRARRRKASAARRGEPQGITPAFRKAAEAERDRRRDNLLRLRDQKFSPRSITKLQPEGCQRTADVWLASQMLGRLGTKVTGNAIASLMVGWPRYQQANVRSLTTKVCKDLHRIRMLESNAGGAPIWKPFVAPQCGSLPDKNHMLKTP